MTFLDNFVNVHSQKQYRKDQFNHILRFPLF